MKTYRLTVTISDNDGSFVDVIFRVARNAAVAMAFTLQIPDVLSVITVSEV